MWSAAIGPASARALVLASGERVFGVIEGDSDCLVDRWTLRQVLERGVLVFECRNCWHLSEMDLLKLVERFGAEAAVGAARARMKCRVCNSKRGRSLVRLKAFRKDLAWRPAPPRARR